MLYNKPHIVINGDYDTETISAAYEEAFPKKEEYKIVNGCDHDFNRNKMKFCPECGAEKTIKQDVSEDVCSEEASSEEMMYFFKRFSGKQDSYANWGDY